MITRFLIAFSFSLCLAGKAAACSCYGWEGGYVSDFSKQYFSAWVVPTSGTVQTRKNEWGLDDVVKYELEIIDSFNFVMQTSITAISSVEDGASCGQQLILGTPQFLTLGRRPKDNAYTSDCSPELPYTAIKAYLLNGEDSYIPSVGRCFGEDGELSKSDPKCKVWEGSASQWRRHGDEDWLKYVKLWRAEQKSRAEISIP